MCLDIEGKRLATASDRGTLIRVFDTSTGTMQHEFRRGSTPAMIQSLVFNKEGSALAVVSDHGTVHLYSCGDAQQNSKSTSVFSSRPASLWLNVILSFSFMSGVVSYLGSTWSSKQFTLLEARSLVAFGPLVDGKQTIQGQFICDRSPHCFYSSRCLWEVLQVPIYS